MNCIPINHTRIIVKKILNTLQELKTEIYCSVSWMQILELLSFLTKVLNAMLAEKFKSVLN